MFFEERLYEIEFYSIKTLLHKVLFNLFDYCVYGK
jgi:hypothetical protein